MPLVARMSTSRINVAAILVLFNTFFGINGGNVAVIFRPCHLFRALNTCSKNAIFYPAKISLFPKVYRVYPTMSPIIT